MNSLSASSRLSVNYLLLVNSRRSDIICSIAVLRAVLVHSDCPLLVLPSSIVVYYLVIIIHGFCMHENLRHDLPQNNECSRISNQSTTPLLHQGPQWQNTPSRANQSRALLPQSSHGHAVSTPYSKVVSNAQVIISHRYYSSMSYQTPSSFVSKAIVP